MNEFKEIVKKEIAFKDKYLSYTKSMLNLPLFTIMTKVEKEVEYKITIPNFEGFKDLIIDFPKLSITTDFMVFSFLLKLFYKNAEDRSCKDIYTVEFNMNEYFDYVGVVRNNRSSAADTLNKSIIKLKKMDFSFVRNDNRYSCGFIDYRVESLKGSRKQTIKLGEHFLEFYKHDPNLIFNVDLDVIKSIKSDCAKILYLFYMTNLHKVGKGNVASFDREMIFYRIASASEDKKKLEIIRTAHKELIEKKIIKGCSFTKDTSKKITAINIEYFPKNKIEEKKDEPVIEDAPAKKEIDLFGNLNVRKK